MNGKFIKSLLLPALLFFSLASFAGLPVKDTLKYRSGVKKSKSPVAINYNTGLPASSHTIENFNSRKGIPVKTVKGFLQSDCWTFRNFDVNRGGWNPGMEGDGALVSGENTGTTLTAAIHTPALNISGSLDLSFNYKFSETIHAGARRWMVLSLAGASGQQPLRLDSFEFSTINAAAHVYARQFKSLPSGGYRLVIQYYAISGSARIAIDQLDISALPAANNSCHSSPIAKNDRVSGSADHYAAGKLVSSDSAYGREKLSYFLIKESPDGKVTINEDGSFAFAPAEKFKGSTTSFIYKICASGPNALCSGDAKMTIYFPTSENDVVGLSDFSGAYLRDGNVELRWSTSFETQTNYYEVERSLDGKSWQAAGRLKGRGSADGSHTYAYMDKVSRNIAFKKDLYYRLKQENEEGKAVFSKLLILRLYNTRTLNMISVTPDPIKNDIRVNVQLQEICFVTMRIIKDDGSLILTKSAKLAKGFNHVMVDGTNELQPGDYMLEVSVNSKEMMLVKLLKETSVVKR